MYKRQALDLTDSEFLIQHRFEPGKPYTPAELADLIDSTLPRIESGKVDMVWGLYIPTVLGAVCDWLANDVLGQESEDPKPESAEEEKAKLRAEVQVYAEGLQRYTDTPGENDGKADS